MEHGHYWDLTPEINAFFRHVLYGESTLTEIGDITVEHGFAVFHSENDLFDTVNFVYTVSTDEDSHKWEWNTVEIKKNNGYYSYAIPEGTVAYCFETVKNSCGEGAGTSLRQSTEIIFTCLR